MVDERKPKVDAASALSNIDPLGPQYRPLIQNPYEPMRIP